MLFSTRIPRVSGLCTIILNNWSWAHKSLYVHVSVNTNSSCILSAKHFSLWKEFTVCAWRELCFLAEPPGRHQFQRHVAVNINTIHVQWLNSSELQGQEGPFFVRGFLVSDRFLKKIIRFVKLRPAFLSIDHRAKSGLRAAFAPKGKPAWKEQIQQGVI